jgi:DMSO/TMAO reductase YedYZ molybdopterin-dependent catalytic subunit
MNGEVLPRVHGYPARFLLPGIYGFKSVKWLERIEVVRGSGGGDWRRQGWTAQGVVHTGTRIDLARRQGDTILLAGIAFAGTRGVQAVEVRVNGGPWQQARLGKALSHATWVQWVIRVRAHAVAQVEARAIDGTGQAQTGRPHGAYPDGSSGWPAVTV